MIAAKHALELGSDGSAEDSLPERMADSLHAFALRDRALVEHAMTTLADRFSRVDPRRQLRVVGRLGTHDYFWRAVDRPLAERIDSLLVQAVAGLTRDSPVPLDTARQLSVVRSPIARSRLPEVTQRFADLPAQQRAMIADRSPDPYFVADVVEFVGHAWTFRLGELAGHTLVRHGPHLSQEDLESALVAWAENRQCLHAFGMPGLAVDLLGATGHLGAGRAAAFRDLLDRAAAHDRDQGTSVAASYQDLRDRLDQLPATGGRLGGGRIGPGPTTDPDH